MELLSFGMHVFYFSVAKQKSREVTLHLDTNCIIGYYNGVEFIITIFNFRCSSSSLLLEDVSRTLKRNGKLISIINTKIFTSNGNSSLEFMKNFEAMIKVLRKSYNS